MTKILIGVDGSDRAHDAVAFGRALALAAARPLAARSLRGTQAGPDRRR